MRVQTNPTPAGFNPSVEIQILHLWGHHLSGRPRGLLSHQSAPPGMETSVTSPRSLILIEVRGRGAGFDPYFPPMHDYDGHPQLRPWNTLGRPYPVGERGASTLDSSSVSMLSSTSSSTTTSESPCWGPSSAIETSLMLQPSICMGDRQGWESPPTEECLSCSSSSSCTPVPPHDSGGDWATSINVPWRPFCGDSALFDISLRDGRGGVGSFWPWELDESHGDLPHGVWDRAHFLLQLQCLLRALLAFGVRGASCPTHRALLGPREGLRWLPEAPAQPCFSSHRCHLASYCEWPSTVPKKGPQTSAMWSRTP